jgi:hypothetical protein
MRRRPLSTTHHSMKSRIVDVGEDHCQDHRLLLWGIAFEGLGSVAKLLGDLTDMFGSLETHSAWLESARDTVDVATPATRATS